MSTVTVRGVSRRFGTTLALDGVDLTLRSGEIHALLGANGAGKTTLVRILAGLDRPDGGTVTVDGEPVTTFEPRRLRGRGVALVQQHFTLVPTLSASRNLVLARPRGRLLSRGGEAGGRLADLVERYGLAVRNDVPAGELSVGEQQRLELLRALDADASVLLLDEPTAVLTAAEADILLATCRRLADEGRAVAFITHRLVEVFAACERVTVLREGRGVIEDEPVTDHTPTGLANAMLGTDPTGPVANPATGPTTNHTTGPTRNPTTNHTTGPTRNPTTNRTTGPTGNPTTNRTTGPTSDPVTGPATNQSGGPAGRHVGAVAAGIPGGDGAGPARRGLRLDGLTLGRLRETTLAVAGGEIVGVAGVDGNGQAELEAVVSGRRAPGSGAVTVGDTPLPAGDPRARRDLGLAYVPSDRYRWGLVGAMDLADNLELGRVPRWRASRARRRRAATGALQEWDVVASGPAQPAGRLSGGNAQKLVLARELAGRPTAVLACHPTRGLDPGATGAVTERLRSCAGDGAAVLWIGAELEELLALADRIVVLAGGVPEGPFEPPYDLGAISLAMTAGATIGADG